MKKDSLKIVLMGLDFNSKNLGCSALGHSFLVALQNTASHLGIQLDLVSVNYASASFKGENYVLRDLPDCIQAICVEQGQTFNPRSSDNWAIQ